MSESIHTPRPRPLSDAWLWGATLILAALIAGVLALPWRLS